MLLCKPCSVMGEIILHLMGAKWPRAALTSMPHLGLWVWTRRSQCHVSSSASFSEAAALFAEPGLTLFPAVLTEETQQSQLHAVFTREMPIPL